MLFTRWAAKPIALSALIGMVAILLIFFSSAAVAQNVPGNLLIEAERSLDEQQWSAALALYEQFIAEYPAHPELPNAIFGAGESLSKLQRYSEALKHYKRLVENFPDWPAKDAAVFRAAICLYQTQKYANAAEALRALISQSPQLDILDKATYWLGEACFRAEHYDEALTAYQSYLQIAPNGEYAPYSLFSIGTIKAHQNLNMALTTFTELLNRFPESDLAADAIYAIGQAHEGLGEYEEAIAWYTKVADREQGSKLAANARAGIASVQVAAGQHTEAAATLAMIARDYAALEIGWKSAIQAGDILFAAKQYEAAALAYEAAGKLPNTPYAGLACYWQGVSYQLASAPTAALDTFRKYITGYPADAQVGNAYLRIADIYLTAGNFSEATAAYNDAITTSPHSPDIVLRADYGLRLAAYRADTTDEHLKALTDLILGNQQSPIAAELALPTADIADSAGKPDLALRLICVITENHPQHQLIAEATLYAGQLLSEIGRTDDAIAEFQHIAQQHFGDDIGNAAQTGIVNTLIAADKLSEASEALTAIPLDKRTAFIRSQLHYDLANAYAARADWETAASQYRDAYDTAPDSPLAPLALAGVGNASVAAHDYGAATTAYRQILTQFPSSPEEEQIRVKYGVALTREGHYAEAQQEFERVLEETSDAEFAAQTLVEIAHTKLAAGNITAAIETYLSVPAQYPKSEQADVSIFEAAELRYKQGNFAAAIILYQRLIDEYTQSALSDEAHYKLAWAFLKSNDPQSALPHFQNAANTADDASIATDASIQAGYIHMHRQEYAMAVLTLEPVVKTTPKAQLPTLLTLLAQAYMFTGAPDRALPLLMQVQDDFPQSATAPNAALLAAKAHAVLKHYEEAAEILQGIARTGDTSLRAQVQFELGEIARLREDFASAARLYRQAATPDAPAEIAANALYMAGISLENVGDGDAAIKTYNDLVRSYPNQQIWLKMAQERLNALNASK